MPPDSLTLAAAAALFAACVGGWRLAASLKAPARLPLRFAAVLLSALAVAAGLRMGNAALLLLPLASTALALGALARFTRPAGPVVATLALVTALACGLGALIGGYAMAGLLPVILSGLCIIAAAMQALALVAILSAVALLAMGLCFLQAGMDGGLLLFAAAALLGLVRPQLLASSSSAARGAALP